MITYTRVIKMILGDRDIEADPVTVEETMRKKFKNGLDGLRTGKFIVECVKAAEKIEKGETT